MKFDSKRFKKLAERDFELAWKKGIEILGKKNLNELYPRVGILPGEEHPVFKTISKLRKAYVSLGFKEVINPVIVEDVHVKRQFGKEALAVLDRCFYVASLPKPNVGISANKIKAVEELIGKRISKNETEKLKDVFHNFKKGLISGDDLVHCISKALSIDDVLAVKVLDQFHEFKELRPEPSTLTLRSHMTTGWFITLSKISNTLPLPIKLFSIDRCFRKEQREGPTRLYTYFSASCVLVDEEVSVEDGKAIAEGILRQFGFRKFKFKKDKKRSKYYIPGTQTEVFAYHPKRDDWIEIATFGVYSPVALAQYEIEYPVLNLGLGVERLAMVLYEYTDIRELVYSLSYGKIELNDIDIARAIRISKTPQTEKGYEIAEALINSAITHADAEGPCKFDVYRGEIYGRNVKVFIVEREKTKLCGPAYANEIVVYNGSIYGIPRTAQWKKYFEDGVPTGIRYIDSFSYLVSKEIEEASMLGKDKVKVRVRVVESLSDINLEIQENVRKYIISAGGKIDVRGPMFVTVEAEID